MRDLIVPYSGNLILIIYLNHVAHDLHKLYLMALGLKPLKKAILFKIILLVAR